jgi:predicted outer membrane repeat protein
MRGLLLLITMGMVAGCGCGRTDIIGETDTSDEEASDPGTDTSVPDLEPEEPSSECGNGIIEEDEACDGGALGGMTCVGLGYDGGTLVCADDCTYDESGCESTPECVRYVDVSTTAFSPDGLSWATAVPMVQHGIDLAAEVGTEEGPCEVWVAEGTYFIYQSGHDDTVQLQPFVHVYGGFAGSEVLREDRDWEEHESILDGRPEDGSTSRVNHVATGSDDTVLDGFVVTQGRVVEGAAVPRGSGLLIQDCSPVIRHCTFRENNSSHEIQDGGAIDITGASRPEILNCTFIENFAGRYGGAINVSGAESVPIISGCMFEMNIAGAHGGAISSWSSAQPIIRNCRFERNEAGKGGALAVGYRGEGLLEMEVTNSVFIGNRAELEGAALYAMNATFPLTNSTFVHNHTEGGTGGALCIILGSVITISNCILWSNSMRPLYVGTEASCVMEYSDIEWGYAGVGNIDADPLLVDSFDADLHIQTGSPCIDAANGSEAPEYDMEGNPRYDDPDTPNTGVGSPGYVDMGAYEYRP